MIANPDVARTLERIADLLEIKGENAFKVRAYRTAAAQVENLGREVADIAAAGGLRDVAGFGEAIATKVEELVTTGRLEYLERLEAEVPPTLIEVRGLPGVGPRTAATLWKEAGITTLEELDAAAHAGRLAGLPRMGAKTLENLLRTLETRRRDGEKRRRPREEVEPLVDVVVAALRTHPAAVRVEAAGSFRRGRPTVGDVDILVATAEPVTVLLAFAALPQVERVLLRGDTKCSVEAAGGLQVDCRAVPVDSFGAAWQYFTGSQAHNVRLRSLALKRGLTLNEYGVFRVEGGGRVAGTTEEEVYGVLGLRWIPPEEREDRGEIDAARLPSQPEAVAVRED